MSAAVELIRGDQDALSFRPLLQPGGALALLVNWGNADEVVVCFRGRFTAGMDLPGGADLTSSAETNSLLVKARLRAGQVCLIQPK